MKNFETLEVGKTYRDRLNNLVMIISNDRHHTYPFNGNNKVSYTIFGSEDGSHMASPNDLIELIDETQTNSDPETDKIQTEDKTYIRRFPSGAIRSDDRGRERPDFVSPYAIHALGKYLANTENSFAKVNYLLGIPVSECWSSLCRHHVELGMLIAKKYTIDPSSVTNEEIEHAAAALTFNGIAMLHTLELIKRGEYKEVYNKTEYILKEEYEKSMGAE